MPKRAAPTEHSVKHTRLKLKFNLGVKSAVITRPSFSDARSIVTFFIGPDREEFIVHKEFLYRHSPTLQRALENEFSDDQTQTYTLDNTTPGAFQFLLQWIYQQKLDVHQLRSKDEQKLLHADEKKKIWLDLEDLHLLEVWILAEKLAIPGLQNAAMDVMVKLVNNKRREIPCHTFRFVWENTDDDESQLRRWVLRQCVFIAAGAFFESEEFFDKDVLLGYAEFIAKMDEKEREKVFGDDEIDSKEFHVLADES